MKEDLVRLEVNICSREHWKDSPACDRLQDLIHETCQAVQKVARAQDCDAHFVEGPPQTPTLKAALKEVAAFLKEHGTEQEYDSDRLKYEFMARELLDLEEWITEDTRLYHPCPECGQVVCVVTCRMAP